MLQRNDEAPWRTDPLYGGMQEESARRSWEAAQRQRAEREALEAREPIDEPASNGSDYDVPLPESPDDYGHGRNLPAVVPPPPRFLPIAIDDVEIAAEPAWLVARILPVRGLGCVVGAPKSGKSFFASDLLFHVARGVPYGGRDVLAGPVMYLTGEGVTGFRRRLVAMRRHSGVEGHGVPFYMIENVPDLGSERTNLDQLLRDLDQFIAGAGLNPPRVIALDTLARCMGDGDESQARDMSRFVRRCGEIERHYGCLILLVHHLGKDASRGARGSNALGGAVDVTLQVEKTDGRSTVTVTEAKDAPDGLEWSFRLAPYDIGDAATAEGDAVSCVVDLLTEPGNPDIAAKQRRRDPAGVAGELLGIIRDAIGTAGQANVGGPVPSGARAIGRDQLKAYCELEGWQKERASSAGSWRATLANNLSKLKTEHLIGYDRDWIWLP